MAGQDRQRRIEAARQSREIISSFEKIGNADHRTLAVHDRVVEAIEDICLKHRGKSTCFTDSQVECLKEVAFHIAYILDPLNKIPSSFLGRVRAEFKNSSWLVKLGFLFAIVSAVAGFFQAIDYTVQGGKWLWAQIAQAEVKPAAAAVIPSPARAPSMLQNGQNMWRSP